MLPFIAAGLALSAFACGTALAADLPGAKNAAPIGETKVDWSGPYVGLHAGAVLNDSDYEARYADSAGFNFLSTAKYDKSPFGAGVYTGYNLAFNSFVVGTESDVTFNFGSKSKITLSNTDPVESVIFKNDITVTVRARLGYALGNILVYTTGGLALNNGNISSDSLPNADAPKGNKMGWVLGAGIEYALTPNIIGRLEYLHTDFGTKSRTQTFVSGSDYEVYLDKVTFRSNIVRAGLAYKF